LGAPVALLVFGLGKWSVLGFVAGCLAFVVEKVEEVDSLR